MVFIKIILKITKIMIALISDEFVGWDTFIILI